MKSLELIAVFFGIVSVWCASRENIRVFPAGIISVAIFIYIFFVGQLYANAAINLMFLITNVYGWYNWSNRNNPKKIVKISRTTAGQNVWMAFAVVMLYAAILIFLRWYNRDDAAYLHSPKSWFDAMNSSLFLCATVLMTVKKLENWIFWIAGDIISIPIFLIQGYYFTSFQYLIFLVLAVFGLYSWKKKLTADG